MRFTRLFPDFYFVWILNRRVLAGFDLLGHTDFFILHPVPSLYSGFFSPSTQEVPRNKIIPYPTRQATLIAASFQLRRQQTALTMRSLLLLAIIAPALAGQAAYGICQAGCASVVMACCWLCLGCCPRRNNTSYHCSMQLRVRNLLCCMSHSSRSPNSMRSRLFRIN
jgi:hypothetical protein